MADQPSKTRGLFASLIDLGRSLVDLVRVVQGSGPVRGETLEPHYNEPPSKLALPAGEAHSEAAQILAQHTPGWHTPNPSILPVPTYAPIMTAFGIVFIALGAVTVWPLSVVGGLIFLLALAKWIGELLP